MKNPRTVSDHGLPAESPAGRHVSTRLARRAVYCKRQMHHDEAFFRPSSRNSASPVIYLNQLGVVSTQYQGRLSRIQLIFLEDFGCTGRIPLPLSLGTGTQPGFTTRRPLNTTRSHRNQETPAWCRREREGGDKWINWMTKTAGPEGMMTH